MSVSARRYITDEVTVTIGAAPVTLEMALLGSAQFTEEVTVSGTAVQAAQAPATIELSPLQVRTVAGAGENIFKVLQTLPGVNATADFDSRISVRGGGPDQNLAIMDGVEIHDPSPPVRPHQRVQPRDGAELRADGRRVRPEVRRQAVVNPGHRQPRGDDDAEAARHGVAQLHRRQRGGRRPDARPGRRVVARSARRTYYDIIANRITDTELPAFTDLQAKGVWQFGPGRTLTLFG